MTRPLSDLAVINAIDLERPRMIDRVTTWSSINSSSHNLPGLKRCASVIRQDFDALGGDTEWLDLPTQAIIDRFGRFNHQPLGSAIRITKRPTAKLKVLLAIHYDTVFGSDHPFQSVDRIDDNTLHGPGVADAKGGLAVMLTALKAFETSPLAGAIGWEILLTPDEEIGSPGSAELFKQAARANDIGLVFEPALPDGSLVGARKGSGNFACVVTGRAAHAGRNPESGRNAITALANLLLDIDGLRHDIPGLTVNIGQIEGGGPVNIVPDLAIARINLRVDSTEQQASVEANLRQIFEHFNTRDGIHGVLHGSFTAPPKLLNEPTLQLLRDIQTCGRSLNTELSWKFAGGVCDGNRLSAAGLPTVDTMGPCGGNLHSDSEYLLLDSLTERAKLTALLLLNYASGQMKPPQKRGVST